MEPKELVKKGYELFAKGDMQTFFTEVVHDDITWIFPGDKHPMSGTHKRVCNKSKRNTSVVCVHKHTVTVETDDDESGYVSVVKEVIQTFCTLR